jgi:hypothetical protein
MGWFSKMVSGSIDKTVDSVGTALDGLFTSDEERLQAKQLITSEMNKFKTSVMEAQSKHDAEITARWKSDNEHSITRLVRPLAFITVRVLFYIIAFADGNIGEFVINEKYIPVFEGLLYTMTIAYFGSRGAEKVTKSIKSSKQ